MLGVALPVTLALAATAGPAPATVGGCVASAQPVGSARVAYAGYADRGAVAYRTPGGGVLARFGPRNANDYPTVFGVLATAAGTSCGGRWYRVELPIRPNGSTGWIRAAALELEPVSTRVLVDLSERQLWLYRNGRLLLRATVGVGAPATPTPTGHYYVDQRLLPENASGPFGPAALGISAYSPVLTWWAQGGPVAIHGTNEPWSIGQAVSEGCVRLPNAVLERVFAAVDAGAPVIIRA